MENVKAYCTYCGGEEVLIQLGPDFISFAHMEVYLIYQVGPLPSMVLIPVRILTSPLSYQHLIHIYLPASEKLLQSHVQVLVDLKSNWKDIQELPQILQRLCVTSDCAHFSLEFSSRHFEESSDGELLVASKYELITGVDIQKSYGDAQNSYLSISVRLFFSWIPIFKRFLPRARKSPFSCQKNMKDVPFPFPFSAKSSSTVFVIGQDTQYCYFMGLFTG